jgi:hypothetical protein
MPEANGFFGFQKHVFLLSLPGLQFDYAWNNLAVS